MFRARHGGIWHYSNDNPILAAAVAGKADLIVSGDKRHMLALGKVEGIPVVTVREALARVRVGEFSELRMGVNHERRNRGTDT